MGTNAGPPAVQATAAALEAIDRLEAAHGRLMFFQSGGCCDGTSPICLKDGELPLGPGDVCLGEVGGASFYIDLDQYERWGKPRFLIDVSPGAAEGFSLEGLAGVHFVTRMPAGSAGESGSAHPVPSASSSAGPGENDSCSAPITRIAAGLDGYREGRDAATLASMIARATGAELMLVAVHPDPMVVLPAEIGWTGMRKQAERLLRDTRDAVAPEARIVIETDWSVPRALERVAEREHRELLVVGSSRRGPEGSVQIGSRTRQLLGNRRRALAVAPRGLSQQPAHELTRIGVGYDGAAESEAALALGGSLAACAAATLRVRGVVDDSVPMIGWRPVQDRVLAMWEELLEPQVAALLERARSASEATGAELAGVDVRRGRPADALMDLCRQVDLLVIGSRRWGGAARVLLGRTGEALMHGASAGVLVVPRP